MLTGPLRVFEAQLGVNRVQGERSTGSWGKESDLESPVGVQRFRRGPVGSRGALWVPGGWGRSLQRTWRSLKGAQGVSGGILRILASLAEVGLVFSGVPEGSMWSLGPGGAGLVAFLGSIGVPVRVLTTSQRDPQHPVGRLRAS